MRRREVSGDESVIGTQLIASDSTHFASVYELWRANSSTLGFFPLGAFEDHARKGRILVATDHAGLFAGYLIYRLSAHRAAIVHLCVSNAYRGRGVARKLVTEFCRLTAAATGASVTCRADFEVNSLWPKLGFVVLGEEPAREYGKYLKRWWLDYGHPNLFTSLDQSPLAILDANVFFDLLGDSSPSNRESAALRANWLRDVFTLALTPEVYNEIDRCPDDDRKRRARGFVPAFALVSATSRDLGALLSELAEVLGPPRSSRDESDHRQLAHAIACGAPHFLTRDGVLLGASVALKKKFGIESVRPSELVCRLDEASRPFAYSPARLDGSELSIRRVRSSEIPHVLRLFQNFPRGESNRGLPTGLREAIADPERFNVDLVLDSSDSMLGLELSSMTSSGSLNIDVLRVTSGVLGGTLARHTLWRTIGRAISERSRLVRFLDQFASDGIDEALAEIGFLRDENCWIKPLLDGTWQANELVDQLAAIAPLTKSTEGIRTLRAKESAQRGDTLVSWRLERLYWPARVRDSGLPCFVVPIKPRWARELFDSRSAEGRLFGADPSLLLRFENAYYRSARPEVLRAPGRVLWYSSDQANERWAKHFCGTSIINDVVLGPPRELFHDYKRYGVFAWSEVAKQKQDDAGRIMAFTFSHTTLLKEPIPFATAARWLSSRTGKYYTFQSPVELKEDVWLDLVALGNAAESTGR